MAFGSGSMVKRVGLTILFLFAACLACDARNLAPVNLHNVETEFSDVSVKPRNNLEPVKELQYTKGETRRLDICTLCEEYATEALNYLNGNKTQSEIVHILHESCSKLHSFELQCITLVDYYAPLFFLEISTIQPGNFCEKVNLCEKWASLGRQLSKNSCDLCQYAITEALLKLKDPDTELEIIEVLLKGCNSVEKYIKKCKRIVFEFAPLILINAEKFLETNDVCTLIHACSSPATASLELPTSEAVSAS